MRVENMPFRIRGLFARSSSDGATVGPARTPGDGGDLNASPMPVILISFNRGEMLNKVVDGYRKQNVAVEIFVHDNGSDDPDTISILRKLEQEGVVVFRREKITSADELDLVDETVQSVFRDRPPAPYAVSDCDVSIAESSPATLATYLRFLEEMPDIECAGPMLRIDDVPATYALYYAMLNRHVLQFWGKEPQVRSIDGAEVGYLPAPIDTTLAVYRAGAPYRRLRKGVRLYQPYAARHLDWYPEEHEVAYRASTNGSRISSWSNPARERFNRYVPLQYSTYQDVVVGAHGEIDVVRRPINDDHNVSTERLLNLMDEVREHLLPTRAGILGSTSLWESCKGVLEVGLGASERLSFEVFAVQDGRWACFVTALTEALVPTLAAAGLEVGGAAKYFVCFFNAGERGIPAGDEVARAIDDVLARVVPA